MQGAREITPILSDSESDFFVKKEKFVLKWCSDLIMDLVSTESIAFRFAFSNPSFTIIKTELTGAIELLQSQNLFVLNFENGLI